MAMDPLQAARDSVVPQIQGTDPNLTLDRRLLWAAIKAAGGSVTVHPGDLTTWIPGTSQITATVDASGAMVLAAV